MVSQQILARESLVVSYATAGVLFWFIQGCELSTSSSESDRIDTEALECVNQPIDNSFATLDSQALFDYDHAPVFDVILPDADWEALKKNAMAEEYISVNACFENKHIGTIGLRFKGDVGSLKRCFDENSSLVCNHFNMKFKFNKYDDEKRFFGMKRLNFHYYQYDKTKMREKLSLDLYREMGIVAPRASFAVVRVNGRIEGLYGMVEQIDGRFAADRWPQFPDGNLYKEVWPTDTDEPFILGRLKTNEDEADISSFLQFTTAINQAQNPTEVLRILGEHTDLDYWARYMAVDDALPNADGITFLYTSDVQNFHNHNYYFYEDAPGHFTLIPWDLEGVFWDFSSSNKAPHWQTPDDCTSMYDYWESNHAVAPRCDPLLDALNLDLAPWRAYAQQLLEGPFSQESMEKNIQRHQEFIRDAIKRFGTSVSPSFFGTEVEYLKTYGIPGQRTRLKKLISNSQ